MPYPKRKRHLRVGLKISNNEYIFTIVEKQEQHVSLIKAFIADQWGSPMSVSRGRMLNTAELHGFLCLDEEQIVGLVTYNIDHGDCEIVTLNSLQANHGLASQLIASTVKKAKASGCKRIWLITTNDNTNAIRYYQKRGFEWVGFYRNSMDESRKLKPEIPEVGDSGIPIKHEIEFELKLS